MNMRTKDLRGSVSPEAALGRLLEGNRRFQQNIKINRDLKEQVRATGGGQSPFATVLGCIDSRVSAELIFDQGVGDIFSVRVAGNLINEDILGSLEFACKIAGTRLILVLGHTGCGAIKGACDNARLGNLTTLIGKIRPAVEAVEEPREPRLRTSSNADFMNRVAIENIRINIDRIRSESPVLRDMERNDDIMIVGGMYDVANGKVSFISGDRRVFELEDTPEGMGGRIPGAPLVQDAPSWQ
ncbi:MAG TPA: carbonic anhydrase [Gammaproteobacteria bacterium]|nr:carbonic anhydrase [Gammaproteobacteria bacterium]